MSSSPTATPQAPGFAYADSCIIADVYGAEETAAAAARYSRKIRKIDGVICVAADAPVTAATVADRLGPARHLHRCRPDRLRQAGDERALRRRRRAGAVVSGNRDPAGIAAHRHRARPRSCHQAGRQPRLPRRAARGAGRGSRQGLLLCPQPFADRARDGRAISLRPAGLDRIGGCGRALLHARLLRPQLRISRTLRALLHREWRRSAEPSAARHSGQGQAGRGARPPPRWASPTARSRATSSSTMASPMSSNWPRGCPAASSARAKFRSTPASISSAPRSAWRWARPCPKRTCSPATSHP